MDIPLAPDLETGNMLAKQPSCLAKVDSARLDEQKFTKNRLATC
ncbi:MAG: hypothetical protein WBM71_14575 [Sedimenticolaceae bacterium]